jgi:hypothetical protein
VRIGGFTFVAEIGGDAGRFSDVLPTFPPQRRAS